VQPGTNVPTALLDKFDRTAKLASFAYCVTAENVGMPISEDFRHSIVTDVSPVFLCRFARFLTFTVLGPECL
jgi:hypothetical protein